MIADKNPRKEKKNITNLIMSLLGCYVLFHNED